MKSAEGAKCNSLGQRPRNDGNLDKSAEGAKCWPLFRAFSARNPIYYISWGVAPGFCISRRWRCVDSRPEVEKL